MKILKMIGIIIIVLLTVIAITCKIFGAKQVSKIKDKFSTGA